MLRHRGPTSVPLATHARRSPAACGSWWRPSRGRCSCRSSLWSVPPAPAAYAGAPWFKPGVALQRQLPGPDRRVGRLEVLGLLHLHRRLADAGHVVHRPQDVDAPARLLAQPVQRRPVLQRLASRCRRRGASGGTSRVGKAQWAPRRRQPRRHVGRVHLVGGRSRPALHLGRPVVVAGRPVRRQLLAARSSATPTRVARSTRPPFIDSNGQPYLMWKSSGVVGSAPDQDQVPRAHRRRPVVRPRFGPRCPSCRPSCRGTGTASRTRRW